MPNVGVWLNFGDLAFAYTGDGGADPDVAALAAGVALLLAEATFPEHVPENSRDLLGSARRAGEHARAAQDEHLVLTHLWPGADPDVAAQTARQTVDGPISIARPGLEIDCP